MIATKHNRRMEDKFKIPPVNGTIAKLTELIKSPLLTDESRSEAIREIGILMLNQHLMLREVSENLAILIKARSYGSDIFWKNIFPSLATFAILGILYLLFENFKP